MGKYDGRKENFIRQVSKANDISLSEARRYYSKEYTDMSDSQRRKIMGDLKNKIKDSYPAQHPSKERDTRGFKFPLKPKGKKSKQALRGALKLRQTKTYPRVVKASKKYPTASKYELQHGVNSKASQGYRLRHGGSRDFK